MVLGRRIEEWLAQDDARREASRLRVEEQLNEWLGGYGLPALSVLLRSDSKHLTKKEREVLDHVIDVVRHRRCTVETCPYRNDSIPDWI